MSKARCVWVLNVRHWWHANLMLPASDTHELPPGTAMLGTHLAFCTCLPSLRMAGMLLQTCSRNTRCLYNRGMIIQTAMSRHRPHHISLHLANPRIAQAGCVSCDVDALSIGGQCLPGTYQLSYTVINDDGISATATRTVVVYQYGSVTGTFTLYKAMTNGTAADATVANLRNISSAEFAQALTTIKTSLGQLGSSLDSSSLDITDATVFASGSTYDVVVTAVIYVYYPSTATRAAINSTSTASSSSSRRRRLLQLDGWSQVNDVGVVDAALGGRRRLQQSGGSSFSSSQSSMSSAMSSTFNATGVSSNSSTASVDLIQVGVFWVRRVPKCGAWHQAAG